MDKVLIIGCSFSAGWYELQIEYPHISKVMEEKVFHDYGWYDELPGHNQYTVYAHPGGGYLNYAYLLYQLYNSGELQKYSKCIIQETWESRISLYHTDKYSLNREEEKIHFYLKDSKLEFIKNIALMEQGNIINTLQTTFDVELTVPWKNYLTDIGNSIYLEAAVDSSALAIDRLLQDANIPTYRFCVNLSRVDRFDDSISNNEWPHIKHMKQMGMWHEMSEIYKHHLCWPKGTNLPDERSGHLTKHGTMLLGKLVATKLTDFL
jgi:hypothetical protein